MKLEHLEVTIGGHMRKTDKIVQAAASVAHDKTDLANHPYLKHGGDKKQLRQQNSELRHRCGELEKEANDAFNCLQDISSFISSNTNFELEPSTIADFEKWKILLSKVLSAKSCKGSAICNPDDCLEWVKCTRRVKL